MASPGSSPTLGHSSIKLTMDTYGHLFEGSDRDSAEKMDRMFGKGSAPSPVLAMREKPAADNNCVLQLVSRAK
jgi:hypothetical protein